LKERVRGGTVADGEVGVVGRIRVGRIIGGTYLLRINRPAGGKPGGGIGIKPALWLSQSGRDSVACFWLVVFARDIAFGVFKFNECLYTSNNI